MSSTNQGYLTSEDMKTIEDAMRRVRSLHGWVAGSENDSRAAAVMVSEFQRGNVTVRGLYEVFLTPEETEPRTRKRQKMKSGLESWENEGGSSPRKPQP